MTSWPEAPSTQGWVQGCSCSSHTFSADLSPNLRDVTVIYMLIFTSSFELQVDVCITSQPLKFSEYRMELGSPSIRQHHSFPVLPSVGKWSPETHRLFISPLLRSPRSNQGHLQKCHLTASCSCSLLWDPTIRQRQTWAKPLVAWPSVHAPPPRYTVLSVLLAPSSSLPQGLHLLSFLQDALPPVPYLVGLLSMQGEA